MCHVLKKSNFLAKIKALFSDRMLELCKFYLRRIEELPLKKKRESPGLKLNTLLLLPVETTFYTQ